MNFPAKVHSLLNENERGSEGGAHVRRVVPGMYAPFQNQGSAERGVAIFATLRAFPMAAPLEKAFIMFF